MRVVSNAGDILPNPRHYISNYSLTISTAGHFTPKNAIIFVGTHNNVSFLNLGQTEEPINLDEMEPYFMTNYSIMEILPDLLSNWTSSIPKTEFTLAMNNLFIPSNISEIYDSNQTIPLFTSTNSSQSYFLTDAKNFSGQPRMNFRCELKTGNGDNTTATWEGKVEREGFENIRK